MSRTKQYDRNDLLDRSIELFRRKGFNGTSTADLVSELGVNRKSMYAEFGSKQSLFEAALERYEDKYLSRVLAVIEKPNAGIEDILKAFYGYAKASEGQYRGLGCLMCNTAVERAALDPASGEYVAAYLNRFTAAFRHALENGLESGDIQDSVNVDSMAQFLTTAMVGISASIRAEAPPEQIWATYEVVDTIFKSQQSLGK